MCSSTPSTPRVTPAPASPEPVKVTDEEVVKARDTARNAALRRYGLRGTDLTGGLVPDDAGGKRRTLGA